MNIRIIFSKSTSGAAALIDAEHKRHGSELDDLINNLNEELISFEEYLSKVEEEERLHAARLAEINKDKSAAESKLGELRIKQMEKAQKETEALEKEYAKIRDKYFGDTEAERAEKFEVAADMLKVIYNREIAAAQDNAARKLEIEEMYLQALEQLRREHGLQVEVETKDSYMRALSGLNDWLEA